MSTQIFITIPKRITGNEELVILPRKVLDGLISRQVAEKDVLRWSREARKMKKEGKLSALRSLRDLR
ncbi:hypothetical protein A3H65_02375 [Candidatus Giovannonibacteria bacterium RIFCSPLOWO2_02_FULL_45_14]|uniref:Uncharacterized protein n=1 Tax=Candidatus Giovannonibacteria bacterium RIFCSPLOWO2_12_FULL_44_15 TaxID=1798364 RepID=A0A1F5XYZ1_9BACT|nr:MAG: hypothetical protein A3C75_02370 [Candidatus Giovannonibacteria bacterium RIFCSPHIGHO2_02_FULL_44_31]OGF76050.1 MAG: hypothetical protein A3E62_02300 [Candidatus Giovannonibacteria bacterium RIFCSPHIGHO2_12_FULL_44_29]OGF91298.1 MAG: hypothetical protein A3H65_02375 [Candidatus Giovannonibacteria bacterium RIFCSPLOWO2_02_FULL_45_14]OGF93108.1 MAG: hypothetical protein A3G54_02495 [Candidatus Giovannonibacteria bacterium RIFCSPLOWO2_12_FULL_44_15]